MPNYGTSSNSLDFVLHEQLAKIRPKSIVDFGAGGGKNGTIVREVLGHTCNITAVEGCAETCKMLSESLIYDCTFEGLISSWFQMDNSTYDVALFGDVLEHLPPREIRNTIEAAKTKFSFLIIVCPLNDIFQGAAYNNPLEIHRTYITEGFFKRYKPEQKHIVADNRYTLMNVLINNNIRSLPFINRIGKYSFHVLMLILQPIGLAGLAVHFLKRNLGMFRWILFRSVKDQL